MSSNNNLNAGQKALSTKLTGLIAVIVLVALAGLPVYLCKNLPAAATPLVIIKKVLSFSTTSMPSMQIYIR